MKDIEIELEYPTHDNRPKGVVVSLYDVNTNTDDIRISYDFERDGWVIQQRNYINEWTEVGFHKAYALEPLA